MKVQIPDEYVLHALSYIFKTSQPLKTKPSFGLPNQQFIFYDYVSIMQYVYTGFCLIFNIIIGKYISDNLLFISYYIICMYVAIHHKEFNLYTYVCTYTLHDTYVITVSLWSQYIPPL